MNTQSAQRLIFERRCYHNIARSGLRQLNKKRIVNQKYKANCHTPEMWQFVNLSQRFNRNAEIYQKELTLGLFGISFEIRFIIWLIAAVG